MYSIPPLEQMGYFAFRAFTSSRSLDSVSFQVS
jgi:hypothetical protein